MALRVVDPLLERAVRLPPSSGRDRTGPAALVRRSHPIANTAFVATYAPNRCGIATFTQDLSAAVGGREIVALHPEGASTDYPAEVRHLIRRDVPTDYAAIARQVSNGPATVVSIQHEYGIWGGPDGEWVLDFVRALRTPAVATLHTVLRSPTTRQRRILAALVDATAATVVMSQSAATLLTREYGVDPTRLEVIAHGVPDLPLLAPDSVKPKLGLEGRTVILSFGLLGPGKGYEAAIAAMPAVVRAVPDALYVILGATHPDLVRREGEAYRQMLETTAASLGVSGSVRFVDRFVGLRELGTWLQAADIFVTPYPNLEQIVSGTLSYAMGAGKAIVSTPYAYAVERLARGRGKLTAPGSPQALADALTEFALDADLRAAYGRRAWDHSRSMVWPEVGAAYRQVFARASRPMVPMLAPVTTLATIRG